MSLRLRRTVVTAAICLLPSAVLAYGVRLHNLLPAHAVGLSHAIDGVLVQRDTLTGIADADLTSFRLWLYERARTMRDTAVRRAFLARYPSAESFNERAFKELMMMNGAAHVLGVDPFGSVYSAMPPADQALDQHQHYVPGSPMPLVTALELGSIYADLDRRNQNRLYRDAAGAVVRTARGDSVPFDPMSLNMGKLTGLSSQAHAHYGLNRHPKSDSVDVLKRAPWDFAIATGFPGPVETYAPDNAQLYTDLALLAALDGQPSGPALGALYAGNAMHYMADVGNSIHTVQVGVYPIFVDATIQYWVRRSIHLFGLLGTTASRNTIGIDIIGNLHTLSERLFDVELTDALRRQAAGNESDVRTSMRGALRALAVGSDSLARALADTLAALRRSSDAPDFGRAITYSVVDAGNRDGAEVYRLTRDLAKARLRSAAWVVDFDTVGDDRVWHFVKVHSGAIIHSQLDDFNDVESRGIARVTSALRAWWAEYVRAASLPAARRPALIDAVVTRLMSERLRYLTAAEARRQAWIASHRSVAAR